MTPHRPRSAPSGTQDPTPDTRHPVTRPALVAALVLVGVVLAAPSRARATDHAFDLAVRQVAAALSTRPVHRHLLGFVDFVAWVSHPVAARGLHIALLPAPADGWPPHPRLERLVAGRLSQWQCIISSWSRRDGDQALVYVRPSGRRFDLLVVALDPGDAATVVQVTVSRHELARALDDHVPGASSAGR